MGIRKNSISLTTFAGALVFCFGARSAEIECNTAQMQAMDKITGRVSIIEVPVDGEAKFGTFSIVVRKCKTRSAEETPENFAFVDVADSSFDEEPFNIFKGWMLSSNPAINPVEHPIYDVWLLKCINKDIDKTALLSADALAARDKLPSVQKIMQETRELSQNTMTEEKSEPLPETVPAQDTVLQNSTEDNTEAEVEKNTSFEAPEQNILIERESDNDFLRAINQELENLE